MTHKTYTGETAINLAETYDISIYKYADPTEGARELIDIDEAREVAAEDPSLVYVTLSADEIGLDEVESDDD